jgi:hypothetical protein
VTETITLDPSFEALWRRKWLVLGGALVCAAVVAAATLVPPARYTTSALVEVGRVMGEQLEVPFSVSQTVYSPGFRGAVRAKSSGGSVTAEALTGGQGRLEHPTLVRLAATGGSPEAAVAAGQAAADEIAARHKSLFDRAVAGYREQERLLAVAGEPGPGAASPSRELLDLRARLASPITTAETALKDAFPVPSAPVPRNTATAAGIGFAVSLAILALLVMAFAQIRPPAGRSEL